MSVASANPFALLLEDDPSRPGSPSPASKKKDAPASQPTRNTAKAAKGPAARGGRYYARGGKPRESTQDNQEEAPAGDESAKKRVDGEGRGRGRGRGRGGRGGRGGGGGHGREYDRHSGTGRTDSDKKVHQGWGGDEGGAELKAEEAGTTDAQAEGVVNSTDDWGASAPTDNWAAPVADDWGAPPPAEGDNAPAVEGEKGDDSRKPREREIEEEDNTISYEQYLAQLKDNVTTSVPKLEGVREANEGADDVWGDIVERKKDEEGEAYFVGKSKSTTKVRAEKKEKVFLEIDARFERPARGGRGRGGDRPRGGDRGRSGGRVGGTKGGRYNGAPTVSVDDETAFPSLS